MALEFFALPDEQISWLRSQISELGLWCWVRFQGESGSLLPEISQLEKSDLIKDEIIEFDIGLSRLAKPVLIRRSGGVKIDFVRSQCVQFEPSRLIDGKILLQGQLAISPRWAYVEASISDIGLRRMYRRLYGALRDAMSQEHSIVQTTTQGTVKEWRDTYLTLGALNFWHKGGLLKQFAEGPIAFGVGTRGKSGLESRPLRKDHRIGDNFRKNYPKE